jgi:hypothetical protein
MWRKTIGCVLLACGLAAPGHAQDNCAALADLGILAALEAQADSTSAPRDPQGLAAALRQASGTGQINALEVAAFDRYLRARLEGHPARFPLSTAELRRRHQACLEQAGSKTSGPAAPGQAAARHALPATPPQSALQRSLAPLAHPSAPDITNAMFKAQLAFALGSVLCGLLGWLIWTRLARIIQRNRRRGRRHLCNLPVIYAVEDAPRMGRIVDLSGLGCKLDPRGQSLAPGQPVQLRLPDRAIDAHVAWANVHYVGLTFDHSLPTAEVEGIVQTQAPRAGWG